MACATAALIAETAAVEASLPVVKSRATLTGWASLASCAACSAVSFLAFLSSFSGARPGRSTILRVPLVPMLLPLSAVAAVSASRLPTSWMPKTLRGAAISHGTQTMICTQQPTCNYLSVVQTNQNENYLHKLKNYFLALKMV